jgi:hypothetical protein
LLLIVFLVTIARGIFTDADAFIQQSLPDMAKTVDEAEGREEQFSAPTDDFTNYGACEASAVEDAEDPVEPFKCPPLIPRSYPPVVYPCYFFYGHRIEASIRRNPISSGC